MKRALALALLAAAPAFADGDKTRTVALHWPAVMPCAQFTTVASSTAVTLRDDATTVLELAADTPRWAALAPGAPIARAKSMRHNAASGEGWVAFGCGDSELQLGFDGGAQAAYGDTPALTEQLRVPETELSALMRDAPEQPEAAAHALLRRFAAAIGACGQRCAPSLASYAAKLERASWKRFIARGAQLPEMLELRSPVGTITIMYGSLCLVEIVVGKVHLVYTPRGGISSNDGGHVIFRDRRLIVSGSLLRAR